jgi:hypothetical protein
MVAAALHRLSSVSFSGAGFLTIYHLGVAQCLLEQGLISLDPPSSSASSEKAQILTGVSGGALAASALVCGISPEKSAEVVLQVAESARNKVLNIYHPGYSLIDAVEKEFLGKLMRDVDDDTLQERLKGGTLRLGVTDMRVFPPFGYNPKAYRYVDSFRSIKDILAVCVLSSYIPGATGPLISSTVSNPAVLNAQETLRELSMLGLVKDYYGKPIPAIEEKKPYPVFLDGGLVNVWPVVDDNTLIVTPLTAHFENNPYICPAAGDSRLLPVNAHCSLALHTDNASTLRDMMWSSLDEVLHERFVQGYDDAKAFLKNSSLLSTVSVATTTLSE